MPSSSHVDTRPRTRRRTRSGWIARVALISLCVQVPMIATLGALGARLGVEWALAGMALPIVLNFPFVRWVRGGIDDHERHPVYLYLVELPFYVMWGTGFLYLLLAPVFALGGLLLGLVRGDGAGFPLDALGAGLAAALLTTLYALVVRRRWPIVTRTELRVRGLPVGLDGYTIVQLSDLHVGGLLPKARADRWVERASALGANLAVVTGDLVAHGDAFIDVVGEVLAGLRAPDGVYACLGNHDYFCDAERLVRVLSSSGVRVLRNEGTVVPGDLYLAGVDDTWSRRADLDRALAGRPSSDMPAVLLAHDPVLFPEAAKRGVDVTLSGHTHGGQIAVPFLSRRFNLARLSSPFTAGLYRLGESLLYVHRGNGTSGPPLRLGSPPEIALLVLRVAS